MGVCANRKIITVAKTGRMSQKSPGTAEAFLDWPVSAYQHSYSLHAAGRKLSLIDPPSQVHVIVPVPAAAVNVIVLLRISDVTGAAFFVVMVITVGSVPETEAVTLAVYFPTMLAGAPAVALVPGQLPLDW